jgi:hypothetical protein
MSLRLLPNHFYFYIEIKNAPNLLGKEMKPPKADRLNCSPEVN